MTEQKDWLRFTEESNALDYLRKVVEFAKRVEAATEDWKWVIISMHGALYGFMVCALKGTDSNNVLCGGKKKRLISFGTALERCQDRTYMDMLTSSTVLQLSLTQKQSINLIHKEFRNAFAHYQPCLWSIELRGMPEIVIDALDVVKFLGLEASNYAHFDADDRKDIDDLVSEGKLVLKNARLFGETQS